MIDWLTLRCPISPELHRVLAPQFDQMLRLKGDEIIYQSPVRDNIRSDSHQVSVYLAGALEIGGSPARVGQHNNVFGSDNIKQSAQSMIDFVARHYQIELPPIENWDCARFDITYNYDLGSESNVTQALEYLSHASDGRIKPSPNKSTVYWNKNSRYQAAKAYGKGQHLHYLTKKGDAKATLKAVSYTHLTLPTTPYV